MTSPMELAIHSALEGIALGEGGPFGAAIIDAQGNILAVAHNTVLKDCDPTCHAEMNAIRRASKHLNNHILKGCTLLTTAEPCPMCLAAIYWARIESVVVGVTRKTAAEYGFDDAYFYEQMALPPDQRQLSFSFGEEAVECERLFRTWKDIEGVLY